MRVLVLVAALVVSGCGPRNLQDCISEAVKLPTGTGVKMARAECAKQFPQPANVFDQFDTAPAAEAQSAATPSTWTTVFNWIADHAAVLVIGAAAIGGMSAALTKKR